MELQGQLEELQVQMRRSSEEAAESQRKAAAREAELSREINSVKELMVSKFTLIGSCVYAWLILSA